MPLRQPLAPGLPHQAAARLQETDESPHQGQILGQWRTDVVEGYTDEETRSDPGAEPDAGVESAGDWIGAFHARLKREAADWAPVARDVERTLARFRAAQAAGRMGLDRVVALTRDAEWAGEYLEAFGEAFAALPEEVRAERAGRVVRRLAASQRRIRWTFARYRAAEWLRARASEAAWRAGQLALRLLKRWRGSSS